MDPPCLWQFIGTSGVLLKVCKSLAERFLTIQKTCLEISERDNRRLAILDARDGTREVGMYSNAHTTPMAQPILLLKASDLGTQTIIY